MTMRPIAPLAAAALLVCSGMAAAQSYPTKPIRMVTVEVGGGADFVARLVAQGLSTSVGQPVVVENRGGGGGIVAAQTVVRAPSDGYTLLFHGSPLWVTPLLQQVPYDPLRDFAPITLADTSPLILAVHPSVEAKSAAELIALTKSRPGALNYASGTTGATPHLAAELFKSMAGARIVRIAYKGTGPALNDTLAGHVQMMFVGTAVGAPHIKARKLKALAVTSAKPSALAPGLPALASAGLPGYEAVSMHGLFAPAKTPLTLVNKLNQEAVRFLNTPEAKERFLNAGLETVASTPSAFTVALKSEIAKWGKLIKDAGIRAD